MYLFYAIFTWTVYSQASHCSNTTFIYILIFGIWSFTFSNPTKVDRQKAAATGPTTIWISQPLPCDVLDCLRGIFAHHAPSIPPGLVEAGHTHGNWFVCFPLYSVPFLSFFLIIPSSSWKRLDSIRKGCPLAPCTWAMRSDDWIIGSPVLLLPLMTRKVGHSNPGFWNHAHRPVRTSALGRQPLTGDNAVTPHLSCLHPV